MEREPTSTARGLTAADNSDAGAEANVRLARRLTLRLDGFAWRALGEEADRLKVSVHDLASFAVLYYLADRDSGRIARRLPQPSDLDQPHPIGKLLGE
ncbi:MAG TPA: hypothetical protein VNV42_03360 [Solirubrobacteraceae bacterium]|nr:hypothetical protein [Solirubrobacteraceae bacterium]